MAFVLCRRHLQLARNAVEDQDKPVDTMPGSFQRTPKQKWKDKWITPTTPDVEPLSTVVPFHHSSLCYHITPLYPVLSRWSQWYLVVLAILAGSSCSGCSTSSMMIHSRLWNRIMCRRVLRVQDEPGQYRLTLLFLLTKQVLCHIIRQLFKS